MTAPVPPPPPGPASPVIQAPAAQAPLPEASPETPWPPDDETLMRLQMDARFSIIDEPAGDQIQGADRQEPTPAGPPQPQQQAPPQTQG